MDPRIDCIPGAITHLRNGWWFQHFTSPRTGKDTYGLYHNTTFEMCSINRSSIIRVAKLVVDGTMDTNSAMVTTPMAER